MMYITDSELERLIKEDIPYFDLTTHALGIKDDIGRIEFQTRNDTLVCGTDEVARIFEMTGVRTEFIQKPGTAAEKGGVIAAGRGHAEKLLAVWKVCQNILEYSCGIADKSFRMVKAVKEVNPKAEVVSTRKNFPGTKALCVNAALCGGVYPHRLGLSESILIFEQHMEFLGGFDGFCSKVFDLRDTIKEKRLIVEVKSIPSALRLTELPVDGIQVDKMPASEIAELVRKLKSVRPDMLVLAAGGIDLHNAAEYAATGADLLVTTAVFNAKQTDIGVTIHSEDEN